MNILKFGGVIVAAAMLGGNFVYDQFGPKPPVVQSYGKSGQVDVLDADMTLDAEMQSKFAEFSTYTYFGAFAVGDDGRGGFLTGANDMASARLYAMEFCTDGEGAEASGCEIYAELRPSDYEETQTPTVNHDTYLEYMDLKENYESYFAVAVTGAGHYGYTYGYSTQWGANGDAMALCNESLAEDEDMVPGKTSCYLVYLDG